MEHHANVVGRFTRDNGGGEWRIALSMGDSARVNVGDSIMVARRNKGPQKCRLGALVTSKGGEALYAIAERGAAASGDDATPPYAPAADDETPPVAAAVAAALPPATNGSVDAAIAGLVSAMGLGALNEARVIELIAQHAPRQSAVIHRVEMKGADGAVRNVEGAHMTFAEMLVAVDAGLPVMLVGPAGSGKTTAAVMLAKELGVPFYFSGAVSDRFQLLGFINAMGVIVETDFSRALTQACVVLIDEVDASAPEALLSINATVDNKMCDLPGGRVAVHPECRFVLTANTYGRGADRVYVGRNQLDGSTLDRYVTIEWGYDRALEAQLTDNVQWLARVWAVRDAIDAVKGIRHIVSARAIKQGAVLLARGGVWTQAKVEAAVLWRGLDADSIAKVNSHIRGGR
jgi:hypothetical protein